MLGSPGGARRGWSGVLQAPSPRAASFTGVASPAAGVQSAALPATHAWTALNDHADTCSVLTGVCPAFQHDPIRASTLRLAGTTSLSTLSQPRASGSSLASRHHPALQCSARTSGSFLTLLCSKSTNKVLFSNLLGTSRSSQSTQLQIYIPPPNPYHFPFRIALLLSCIPSFPPVLSSLQSSQSNS